MLKGINLTEPISIRWKICFTIFRGGHRGSSLFVKDIYCGGVRCIPSSAQYLPGPAFTNLQTRIHTVLH